MCGAAWIRASSSAASSRVSSGPATAPPSAVTLPSRVAGLERHVAQSVDRRRARAGSAQHRAVHPANQDTWTVGLQQSGSIVGSDNQLLTPAGTTVQFGSPTVAKAVAVNPNARTKSGAVLLMDAAQPIIVFSTTTGEVLQRNVPATANGTDGTFTGVAYSADGLKLLFSRDNDFVVVADVDPFSGKLTPGGSIALPRYRPTRCHSTRSRPIPAASSSPTAPSAWLR